MPPRSPLVALRANTGCLPLSIIIQVYLNASLACVFYHTYGSAHSAAAPAALIGANNFFELTVAAAISLFGLQSSAALATDVGVPVEVPVGRRSFGS